MIFSLFKINFYFLLIADEKNKSIASNLIADIIPSDDELEGQFSTAATGMCLLNIFMF